MILMKGKTIISMKTNRNSLTKINDGKESNFSIFKGVTLLLHQTLSGK